MRRSLAKWVRTSLARLTGGLDFLGPTAVVLLAAGLALGVQAYRVSGSFFSALLRVVLFALLAAVAVRYRRRVMRERSELLAQPRRRVKNAGADEAFYELGVEREAGEALELLGQEGPHAPYVPRVGDDQLRERISSALDKWGVTLIVVSGPPTAGKTRTLAEAMAASAGNAWLIVPRDADAVAKLARDRAPVPLITLRRSCVVWLDDLERFVRARGAGLDEATIKEFGGWRRPVVLLATAGGKGLRFGRTEAEQHAKVQSELLRVHEPHLLSEALNEQERGWMRAMEGYGDSAVEQMTDRGIAEFMVAATRKRLLLDVPSEKPVLGVEPVARALRDIVVQSEPRFAVGIFGGWGSGKTTLMQAIEARLADRNVVCVRFVAWRYEKEEHLIVPLLDAIREALVEWAARNDHDRAARETAATVGKVVHSILAGVSLQAGLPGAMKLSFEANKSLQEYGRMRNEEQARRVPRSFYHASFMALKTAFEDFVHEGADRRIAVFVDDLDRCLPENALQILESMKLFFDLDGFVFIVGLDENVIEYAVEKRYRGEQHNGSGADDNGERRISGKEYIKKIFQLPYRLSPVSSSQLADFVRAAAQEARLSEEQERELRTIVEPHLRFLAREGAINPREVKRYINLYTVQSQVATDLEPNVVLALQTLSFRAEWEETVWDALLEFRDEYVDAVRRRLVVSDDFSRRDLPGEFTDFPDEFLDYVSDGAPGHVLLETDDLDRYLSLGESVRSTRSPALLEALRVFGQVHTGLVAARAGTMRANLAGELSSLLSAVEGKVVATLGGTPRGVATTNELRALRETVSEVVGPLDPTALPDPDQLERQLDPIVAQAESLSGRLRKLYRAGETIEAGVSPPAKRKRPPPPPAVPASEAAPPAPPSVVELPSRRLHDLAPEDLGVTPAAVASADYVVRDADVRLRSELASAAAGGPPALIVLVGPAKAGKSRTLYEALTSEPVLHDAVVVTPVDAPALIDAVDPAAVEQLPPGPVVIWLDDLERFLSLSGPGLRAATVTAITKLPRRAIALATARDTTQLDELARHPDVSVVRLRRQLSPDETERFAEAYPAESVDELKEPGIGGWASGANALSDRLRSTESPEGAAVVRATVDWTRAGMARPISDDTLRTLWPYYLEEGSPTPERFATGLEWALHEVSPAGGLIFRTGDGYAAFDWTVVEAQRAGPVQLHPEVWKVLLEQADSEEALELGVRAGERGELDACAAALAKAQRAAEPLVAGRAFLESGRQLVRTMDDKGAETAFRRAEEHGIVQAIDELGELFSRKGDDDAAESAFRRADDQGSASAATHLGRILLARGDASGAAAAFERAVERGDSDGMLLLSEALTAQGDARRAEWALRRADEQGSAEAALKIGYLLEQRGDRAGAAAAFARSDDRGSAEAARVRGASFAREDDAEQAEAAYRRAVERGQVAAAIDLGDLLRKQPERALEAYRMALDADPDTDARARKAIADLGEIDE
jgi:tetratricopeptide (TPR) repeat protein